MGRAPCCDKTNVKRGPWSPEEDATLKNYIHKNGTCGNWISLPQRAGLRRCGKSCRLRWLNYLRPDIKHGDFTEEEDTIIISMYYKIGSRWSVIAANLAGRTDNDVKNHWNTKLKKKVFDLPSNRKFSPTIIPPNINNSNINNHVIFTNKNAKNPIFQLPTPSYVDNNLCSNNNQVLTHQFYVPIPSFSDLLSHNNTNNASSMSLLPNFATQANDDPIGVPDLIRYPVYNNQDLMVNQGSSAAFSNVDNNVSVFSHEEVSSASGSSPVFYGSSFEEDPFFAELGFG